MLAKVGPVTEVHRVAESHSWISVLPLAHCFGCAFDFLLQVARGLHIVFMSLEVGQTITVEPGIYIPGLGGVRVENTCAITENGGRTLVHAQKALLIL